MIAWFGTGLLGAGFVGALRRRGEDVRVWNRTPEKARALESVGAQVAQVRSAVERAVQRKTTVFAAGPENGSATEFIIHTTLLRTFL